MPDFSLFGDEHVRQYEATGGRVGHDWNGAHCLILHTVARKSGQARKFPLIYGRDGDDYVVVASKGGAPDHPGWYKNILANPEVEVQVGPKTVKARARTVSGAERQKLWDDAVKWWPPYVDYQKKTQREIPVVMLDPV